MKVYSVSEITAGIKELLESEFPEAWIEGEVTDYRPSPTGHLYFSLKDEFALLNCIIWKENRTLATVALKNGAKVRIYGNLRVYAKGGRYNLQVERVYPMGIGELQIKFEELKHKLAQEGLFASAHKKPIPRWVNRIGVITALDGAAVRDIIRVAHRRYPGIQIIVRSSRVQGAGAAQDIAQGIMEFNEYGEVDLLIVGRGGGSIEALWAFNEEVVAQAIYNSRIPVISAVGHEIDWTIADFVADYRAPTPSAAAEIAVADSEEILEKLSSFEHRIEDRTRKNIEDARDKINSIERSYGLKRLFDLIHTHWQTIDEFGYRIGISFAHPLEQKRAEFEFTVQRFNQGMKHFLEWELQRIKVIDARMRGINPRATLQRGYSICYKLPEKKVVKMSNALLPKEKVEIEFYEGKAECEVLNANEV
ncbi:exodeoxyribonuclease VII large subunit [candidate division WOR-3 bacterium]|nr:exodeoxyribonuclease VII large subunit [candidate division WOR-3 bacterium]